MSLHSSPALELEVAVRRKVHRPVMDGAGRARGRKGAAEAPDRLNCAEALGGPEAERVSRRLVAALLDRHGARGVGAMMVFMVKSPITVSDEISASSVVGVERSR
jgi:hypothetical protein